MLERSQAARERDRLDLFAAAAAVAVVRKGQRVGEGREEGLGVCIARESGGRRVEDARRL